MEVEYNIAYHIMIEYFYDGPREDLPMFEKELCEGLDDALIRLALSDWRFAKATWSIKLFNEGCSACKITFDSGGEPLPVLEEFNLHDVVLEAIDEVEENAMDEYRVRLDILNSNKERSK